ncbi:hypothetical protein C4K35_1927 [Pseudomonas chlororaphis subsp. piscium]|uniref:hypothetical protein n=1 Tax=Pseudomonas chlororaphis TaxID=587753 RepID=UPI000F587922|nr:hypothetical protein [Pseudomonas chlororaphis]AZC49520.1 hypothetical protein C4K35_1927 [Pseudomonas chlororaphis subsp. piscium]
MNPPRSSYRAFKIITQSQQEIALKPLAVFLYEVAPGVAYKCVIHRAPFGEDICLSDFRTGIELTRCHPKQKPLDHLLGPLKGDLYNETRALWIEVGKDFLEAYLAAHEPGDFEKSLEILSMAPGRNGGHST